MPGERRRPHRPSTVSMRRWGERALIRWLRERPSTSLRPSASPVVEGIGDDAAVIAVRGGEKLLLSCDLLVEGVHFERRYAGPRQLGWKAAAVNLSDIAAMGGRPIHLLVSLAVPPQLDMRWVRAFYSGMRRLADAHGVSIVGGDTSASPGPLFVDVTVVGSCRRPVLRRGAKPGDAIVVSRTLGDSAAGLLALQSATIDRVLMRRHLCPHPEIALGRALAARGIPSAMIDLSDGLSRDLRNLCEASRCGARVEAEALPISRAVRRLCARLSRDPLAMALHGGEDYGLLFAVPQRKIRELERFGGLHRIGTIVRRGYWLRERGGTRPLPDFSWTHFGERKSDES